MTSTDDPFAGRLLPGEHILWSGRPAQGLVFSGQDVFIVPFSLLWCGFAVFCETTMMVTGAPIWSRLYGLTFVVGGLYFVAGRFLFDSWVRTATRYAVTNKRVLVSRARPTSAFVALWLTEMQEPAIGEGAQGRGTLRFGPEAWVRHGLYHWTLSPALDPTPQFVAINEARRVFDIVQQARDSA